MRNIFLDIKLPTNPIKNGVWSKQRILSRRITNGKKTLKKLLNIPSHQGNANQNDSEIPSYTSQND